MNSPKSFLFDIGKVLLDFDFEGSLERLLPPGTPDAQCRLTRVLEPKDAFERGDIPLNDYLKHSLDVLGPQVSEADFLAAWRGIFTPNLPMWEVVSRLKDQGHRLFLFSNINAIHCPWVLETYRVFDAFDGGTYSFEAGSIKPETSIYQTAIDTHGLVPSETLYIDDLPANIATGSALGFRTHQYDLQQHNAFEQWLQNELER